MLQLIFNPNNKVYIVCLESIAHKFENIDITLTPVSTDNIILIKDNKIIANNIIELENAFHVESYKDIKKDNPYKDIKKDNESEKKLSSKEIEELWANEDKEEKEGQYIDYNKEFERYRKSKAKTDHPEKKCIRKTFA